MLILYTTLIEDENDKTKFEKIYDSYHRLMLWKASQILKDSMAVEDAVQNAFLKIIRHLDDIDIEKEDKTKSFVLIITERASLDLWRKANRHKIVSLDELEDWQIPWDNRMDAELSDLEEENRIIELIKSMPSLYREIFLLKYSNGYENHQIAEMLGISEPLVRKRISRGKEKLEQLLREGGILCE